MLLIQQQESPHYFTKDHSARHALREMLAEAKLARRSLPMKLTGSFKLSRDEDKFVVTTSTPGIKLEYLTLELVDQRTLRLQVVQPWTPRGATQVAEPAPAPPTEAIAEASAVEMTPRETLDTNAPVTKPDAEDCMTEVAEDTTAAPYFAADITQALADEPRQEETVNMIVVLDKSICLPQLVDFAGITSTYTEGLLRIEIPITALSPDAEHTALMTSLLAQKSEAIAELAALEQRLKEQRDKVHAAHASIRAAKTASAPALARKTQALNITPPASAVLESESEETKEETKEGAQV